MAGWKTERELEREAQRWLRENAKDYPYYVSEKEYLQSITIDERRQHRMDVEKSLAVARQYDPQYYTKFFQGKPEDYIQGIRSGIFTRPVVGIDIETDDKQRPISISALKGVYDRKGVFHVIAPYERFYLAADKDLVTTSPIHGFTAQSLLAHREHQGVTDYPEAYNKHELHALQKFIGDSIIVGHNIVGFDIPTLFPNKIKNQTIDTLIASRNMFGANVPNALDFAFRRITGKTMEGAGLPHHVSMADTIASLMMLSSMMTSVSDTGAAIRNIFKYGELNLAPVDEMIGSQLFHGPYWAMQGPDAARQYITEYDIKHNRRGILPMTNDPIDFDQLSKDVGTSMGPELPPIQAEDTDLGLGLSALAGTIKDLSKALGTIQDSARDTLGFANTLNTYKRADYIKTLSMVSNREMSNVAKGLNIPETEQWDFISAAQSIRNARQFNKRFTELRSYYRAGEGQTEWAKRLRKELTYYDEWSIEHPDILDLDEKMAADKQYFKNAQYVEEQKRKGKITELQAENIDLTQSYDDVVTATDKATKSLGGWLGVMEAVSRIKIYDPLQYLESVRGQASSINAAARGVLPNFVVNAGSRFSSAIFNHMDERLTGWRRAKSVWESGVGNAVGAGTSMAGAAIGATIGTAVGVGPVVGGMIGSMTGPAVKGLVSGVSQIVGNVKQGQMEQAGYHIQNTLNTLGGIIDWVSAPFQILHKVLKTVIGDFGILTHSIRGLLNSGISSMSQMGNPLTELTGIGYQQYAGTTMMDVASLFNRGSLNSTIENFAQQQRALYTLGDLNTNRVIGASLLGVFDEVYTPTTDAKGSYMRMANKILNNMQGRSEEEKASMMYKASLIDNNLAGLLHTANMLGITDVNKLMDPSHRGMYWNPIHEGREEQRMRWTQYEYGAATSQFGTVRMRFAATIWESFGKDLFNGFNTVLDKLASKNWKGAFQEAVNTWQTFKKDMTTVWKDFNGEFDVSGRIQSGLKNFGLTLAQEVIKLSGQILTVWDNLILKLTGKLQGFIAYVSTINIKPKMTKDGLSLEINTIDTWANQIKGSSKIAYRTATSGARDYRTYDTKARDGMENLFSVYEQITGKKPSASTTVEDVRQAVFDFAAYNEAVMNDPVAYREVYGHLKNLELSGYEGQGFSPVGSEEAERFWKLLLRDTYQGSSLDKASAVLYGYQIGQKDHVDKQDVYDKSGIYTGARDIVKGQIEPTVKQAVDGAVTFLESQKDKRIQIDFRVNGKPAGNIDTDGKTINKNIFSHLTDVITDGVRFISAQSY